MSNMYTMVWFPGYLGYRKQKCTVTWSKGSRYLRGQPPILALLTTRNRLSG